MDAVAVMPPEDLADASAPHRAAALRKAAPSELLFMLKRYDDENPPQQSRLDVIRTCIMAAYPDAVANDARYQSAMRWFWSLEAGRRELRRRPERREQALRRARAPGKQKVADALEKKQACEMRALRQCDSVGGCGGGYGSYLCTRHRRDATVSSAVLRSPRRVAEGGRQTANRGQWSPFCVGGTENTPNLW